MLTVSFLRFISQISIKGNNSTETAEMGFVSLSFESQYNNYLTASEHQMTINHLNTTYVQYRFA